MSKPSPQLTLSAAACVLAMAALSLSAPTIEDYPQGAGSPVATMAGEHAWPFAALRLFAR